MSPYVKPLYILYQYLIAFPLFIIETIIVALITIYCANYKYKMWLHAIQAFWARSFCYLLLLPVSVEGNELINANTSYVFVSNHQSIVDIFLIYGWLPVMFKWLIKKEIHNIPFIGIGCDAAGHIFVERSNRHSSVHSVRKLERVLHDGCSTVIFPEGHRSANGHLQNFRRGAFQIAVDMHVPIVPIALCNCYTVTNGQTPYCNRHPIKLVIGTPISPDTEENNIEFIMTSCHSFIQEQLLKHQQL